MRADRSSHAGAGQSQPHLHLSDGPRRAGASVADRERLLPKVRLAADDVEPGDQLRWNRTGTFFGSPIVLLTMSSNGMSASGVPAMSSFSLST
jgi:hypothetical protein